MVIKWTFNARENIRSIRDYLEGEKVHQDTINEVIRSIIDAPTRLKNHPKHNNSGIEVSTQLEELIDAI